MKKTYVEPNIETIVFDLEEAITANDPVSSNKTQIMDGDFIDWE